MWLHRFISNTVQVRFMSYFCWIFWFIINCNADTVLNTGTLETDPIVNRPLPYALSATDLTYLAMKEQTIYHTFSNYAKELEERLRLIHTYLKDYEDSSLQIMQNLQKEEKDAWKKATVVATNTVTAYKMIRRFAKDFRKVENTLSKRLENNLMYELSKASGVHGFPSESDHTEAMDALLRLHYFYDLDIQKFSGDRDTGMGMGDEGDFNAKQAMEIAHYAVYKGYFTLAMDWLDAAESKLHVEFENSTSVTLRDVAELRERTVTLHDMNWNTKDFEESKYLFSTKLRESQNSTAVKRVLQLKLNKIMNDDKENNHNAFVALCNGQNFQAKEEASHLYCWYDRTSNPYWTINPLKKELLNSNPPLVQIYNVISDSWIAYLTRRALPTLQRAPVSRATPRTATYAWLSDEDIEDIPLSRRLELITGLNIMGDLASEYLQIAAYAFGGHVCTHVDSLPENPYDNVIREKGNRVATVLIYLNDVAKGGRTAFPLLGTSVEPLKGSAVFWYTAKRNGDIDRRTLHAACPVLGHKWIATKWAHLNQNAFKRPCSTHPSV